MKKIFLFFVMLLSTSAFAQWGSVKETNINVSSSLSVDIFTNRDGNHIIVQESNNLKYYKMNLNGVAGLPLTIESSGVVSPSISGDADNIYIVYGMGSQMRIRRSTNGGASFSLLLPTFNLATPASWMESEVSNQNLHVTYLESGIVKYKYRNPNSGWTGEMIVSTGETGTLPRITASYGGSGKDSVYFMWQKAGTYQINHRRYEVTSNSWSSILYGHTVSDPNVNIYSANLAGFRVTATTTVVYFAYEGIDIFSGNYWNFFNWVWRDRSNNNFLGIANPPKLISQKNVYTTTTFDGNSHTAYYFKEIAGGEGGSQTSFSISRSKQASGYPNDIIYDYGFNPPSYDPLHVNLSSAGNEVHAIWRDSFGSNNGNNLRYRWDNQNPIAPQNLTMTSHNNHPKLVWQKNPEQDVDYYRVYRKKGSGNWTLHTTVSASLPTEYVDNEETVCNPPPGAHCESQVVAKYYITAVDLTSKVSSASNEVEAILQGTPPSKATANDPFIETVYDYSLSQNYPNPFNPSTRITYSIKTTGLVTLKVFDMLGKEVAELVNEAKEAGNYSVTFNASELPSGIYFYSLTSGNFTATKKLILLR